MPHFFVTFMTLLTSPTTCCAGTNRLRCRHACNRSAACSACRRPNGSPGVRRAGIRTPPIARDDSVMFVIALDDTRFDRTQPLHIDVRAGVGGVAPWAVAERYLKTSLRMPVSVPGSSFRAAFIFDNLFTTVLRGPTEGKRQWQL
jgi:hypothetical protein